MKKHLEKYEEAVLVKEVFCRGRFLLVKLAYPNYSTLLSDRMLQVDRGKNNKSYERK